MFSAAAKHAAQAISEATLETHPFTWFQADNVWPSEFYHNMLLHRIPNDCLFDMANSRWARTTYETHRLFLNLEPKITILDENLRKFWQNFHVMFTDFIEPALKDKFRPHEPVTGRELIYIRDGENYSLGPHVDKNHKLMVGLFYLPPNDTNSTLGTTLYTPKQSGFTGQGGKHMSFNEFDVYRTIDYVPNKLLGLVKCSHAFHGVQPITKIVERDLLIFNVFSSNA